MTFRAYLAVLQVVHDQINISQFKKIMINDYLGISISIVDADCPELMQQTF